jgi:hypothetical protein
MAGIGPTGHAVRRAAVPVDQRWFGLQRRSVVPGVVVIAIWFLWSVVVPHVNDAVAYDDEVRAGEQFSLTADLVFTPAVGWNVRQGFRTTEAPTGAPAGRCR